MFHQQLPDSKVHHLAAQGAKERMPLATNSCVFDNRPCKRTIGNDIFVNAVNI
jgi:hypothetical protein